MRLSDLVRKQIYIQEEYVNENSQSNRRKTGFR